MTEKRSCYQKQYWEQYKTQKKRVSIVLDKREYLAFDRASQGENTTAFIKALAIAGLAGQTSVPKHLQDELQTLNGLIRNIANNLNQLSHSANIFGEVEQKRVFNHLIELDKAVNDFIQDKAKS